MEQPVCLYCFEKVNRKKGCRTCSATFHLRCQRKFSSRCAVCRTETGIKNCREYTASIHIFQNEPEPSGDDFDTQPFDNHFPELLPNLSVTSSVSVVTRTDSEIEIIVSEIHRQISDRTWWDFNRVGYPW